MSPTRRDFIRHVGIAMAALVMGRCNPLMGGEDSSRGRLRTCWLGFDQLAQQTRENMDNWERGERAKDELIDDHRAALDKLVAKGELDAAVADQVQAAYRAAAYHIWRSNAPITCYEPMIVDYTPTSADQLVQQAGILATVAESSELDPDTVERARATIERDIAFLTLSQAEIQTMYEGLTEAAGDTHSFPPFDQVALDIPPEATDATRFLIELLLEE